LHVAINIDITITIIIIIIIITITITHRPPRACDAPDQTIRPQNLRGG